GYQHDRRLTHRRRVEYHLHALRVAHPYPVRAALDHPRRPVALPDALQQRVRRLPDAEGERPLRAPGDADTLREELRDEVPETPVRRQQDSAAFEEAVDALPPRLHVDVAGAADEDDVVVLEVREPVARIYQRLLRSVAVGQDFLDVVVITPHGEQPPPPLRRLDHLGLAGDGANLVLHHSVENVAYVAHRFLPFPDSKSVTGRMAFFDSALTKYPRMKRKRAAMADTTKAPRSLSRVIR